MSRKTEDKEKEKLLEFFSKLDKKMLRDVAEVISVLVRAFDGKPPEGEDAITRLTNVKDILERSRFPTYPLLAKQVYLRLIAKYAPEEAYACEDWANLEARALISYKGESRKEYTEQLKHASGATEEQRIFVGALPRMQPEKKGFLRGFRKAKEESEFVAQ